MIDAVVGIAILGAAMSSLMLALEFSQRAVEEAGYNELSRSERTLMERSGYKDDIISGTNEWLQRK